MSYSLGIDLGTTYTAAAVCRNGTVEIIPLGNRAPQVPSVIFNPDDGPPILGEPAVRHALTEPDRVARQFKLRMGDDVDIYLGGTPMSAVSLSKMMLKWVIDHVAAGQGAPPARVTVACPADWGPFRRGRMNKVLEVSAEAETSLCTEPEAAAVHFASTGRLSIGDPIAIYDLGGGTFDVTVLRRVGESDFELLGSPQGDREIGGVAFDTRVLHWVLAKSHIEVADPDDPLIVAGLERLRTDCIDAKEALSSEIAVTVPVVLGTQNALVRLTRGDFDDLIGREIDRTVDDLTEAVHSAGVVPADLSAVVLVGGSAQIPRVSEVITQRLRCPVTVSPQPKLCVAMGAALIGAAKLRAALPEVAEPSQPTVVSRPFEVVAPRSGTEASGTLLGGQPGPDSTTTADSPPVVPIPDQPAASATAPPTAAGAVSVTSTPLARARMRRPSWHRIASAVLAIFAILLTTLGGVISPRDFAIDMSTTDKVTTTPVDVRDGTPLQPRLLGHAWGRPALSATKGTFVLGPWQVILSGPIQATLGKGNGAKDVLLVPKDKAYNVRRLATVPGVVAILGALFSFAYGESLLRGVRRRRRAPTIGEVIGLVGAGAVAGAVLASCRYLFGSHSLTTSVVAVVIMCVCAAVGLLPFGWDRRARAGSEKGS